MQRTQEYQTLLEACKQEGCPLCRLAHESVYRYLDSWKYELFTDTEVRAELRRTQGFCHQHTWQLVNMGATLPLAQAYRDILTDQISQIQNNGVAPAIPGSNGGLLRRIFENTKKEPAPCPACLQRAQADKNNVHTLRKVMLDDDFYEQFAASHGLCIEHFQMSGEPKTSGAPAAWLARLQQAQVGCLQRLEKELSELIRKHDYRFRDEERGREMHSWKRAAAFVAGEASDTGS